VVSEAAWFVRRQQPGPQPLASGPGPCSGMPGEPDVTAIVDPYTRDRSNRTIGNQDFNPATEVVPTTLCSLSLNAIGSFGAEQCSEARRIATQVIITREYHIIARWERKPARSTRSSIRLEETSIQTLAFYLRRCFETGS
jgi:hypothetical protein